MSLIVVIVGKSALSSAIRLFYFGGNVLYLIGLIVIVFALWWFLRSKKYDKQALLDFDVWANRYLSSSSPLEQSSMATALLAQSVHLAWSTGVINSKQRDVVMPTLQRIGAKAALGIWMDSSLPVIYRVLGEDELSKTPARAAGMLMLIVWMTPDHDKEHALRGFLLGR